jgi:translation initiation factor 2B subunit (eIF-2B alpha/beta/delta family)
LSKVDSKLRTPTPTGPSSLEANPWVSQTPRNPNEAISQSEHVQKRISNHQGSSPTSMFSAIKQLAKGMELIAHQNALLQDEVRTLQQANQALAKRRRAKRTRVQAGGAITIEDAQVLLAAKDSSSK